MFLKPLDFNKSVSKTALQLWKLIRTYSEDMYSVWNCHSVAKHTEVYLR
jgi:hypothetical protein